MKLDKRVQTMQHATVCVCVCVCEVGAISISNLGLLHPSKPSAEFLLQATLQTLNITFKRQFVFYFFYVKPLTVTNTFLSQQNTSTKTVEVTMGKFPSPSMTYNNNPFINY
jgi:hypothetical protein